MRDSPKRYLVPFFLLVMCRLISDENRSTKHFAII